MRMVKLMLLLVSCLSVASSVYAQGWFGSSKKDKVEKSVLAAPVISVTPTDAPSSSSVSSKPVSASNGIPSTLDECFPPLQLQMAENLEAFKKADHSNLESYKAGYGEWIKFTWITPSGSSLREYFNGQGVFNPTEIAEVIILSFHAWLNGKPVNLKQELSLIRGTKVEPAPEAPIIEEKESAMFEDVKDAVVSDVVEGDTLEDSVKSDDSFEEWLTSGQVNAEIK